MEIINNQKIKEYWSKLSPKYGYGNNQSLMNPARVWFILVVSFFFGLVIVFLGIFFFKWQIINKIDSLIAESEAVTEKLEEEKLKLILLDQTSRVEEFNKLQKEKPTVIDPGV